MGHFEIASSSLALCFAELCAAVLCFAELCAAVLCFAELLCCSIMLC